MNAPRSADGWAIWDLVQRLGGQMRVVPVGPGRPWITGIDMAAALALAEASGIDRAVAAEILPAVERVMVDKLNKD